MLAPVFPIEISGLPEGVTPVAYRIAVPGDSILLANGPGKWRVNDVTQESTLPKLIVEISKWRTPSLPQDAGKVCQFRNHEQNGWEERVLLGFVTHADDYPWRTTGGYWRYARIEDEGKSA